MSERTSKSLRGETVNFDLFAIKSQMASAPKPDTVVKRERFVNKKRRRSVVSKLDKMAQAKALEEKNFDAKMEAEAEVHVEAIAVEATETVVESGDATPAATRRRRGTQLS